MGKNGARNLVRTEDTFLYDLRYEGSYNYVQYRYFDDNSIEVIDLEDNEIIGRGKIYLWGLYEVIKFYEEE